MYNKFREIFDGYYKDISSKIWMVPNFDVMELADTLLFEIALEVKFKANNIKYHEETKTLVGTLIIEFRRLAKKNHASQRYS